jgi:hypothetical protein
MNGFAFFPLIIFGFIAFLLLGFVLIFLFRDKSKDIKNNKQALKGLVGVLSGKMGNSMPVVERVRRD